MNVEFVWITPAPRGKPGPAADLYADFAGRIGHFAPCETKSYPSEAAFLLALDKRKGRAPFLVMLDSTGRQFTSADFARQMDRLQHAEQVVIFAIGPADGWSAAARERAGLLLSLGAITLPHQLARVVLAEQVYRAFTILAGHPYHSGH